MFKGVKYQIGLPVAFIALLLISAGAIGFSFWAGRHEEQIMQQQVADKVASVKAVLATTEDLMEDRSRSSMALFIDQINSHGGADHGAPVVVGTTPAHDIIVGGKGQANNFDIVDNVTHFMKGTATLFSKEGSDFVRIATNVKKSDGSRAIGTKLDSTNRAYAAVSKGEAFYGVVDILGTAYFTGYEPLYGKTGDVIGITYVGYKVNLPVLNNALDQSRLLETGFVAIADKNNQVRYQPSWMTPEQAQARVTNQDGSWVVDEIPLAEWNLVIVSAYPISELRSISRNVGLSIAIAGLLIGALISMALFFLLDNQVLRLLGGEPRTAAMHMKRIADGDLTFEIGVAEGDTSSLMASLKVMQMKLKNLVNAVQGGAAELNEHGRKFEVAANTFQKTKDDTAAQELLRHTKSVGNTLAILEKTIGRFKI